MLAPPLSFYVLLLPTLRSSITFNFDVPTALANGAVTTWASHNVLMPFAWSSLSLTLALVQKLHIDKYADVVRMKLHFKYSTTNIYIIIALPPYTVACVLFHFFTLSLFALLPSTTSVFSQ